ncbi:50S ribosomal protein L35 [Candidatus Saccharibacteria bacterium RIFCSPHIGHO2_12_FULL_41_12]|nr:MAG: 50S ribosomal protein L35 [Candidatus Saccharibacteria bacterium RIFCSPHIGHO2_12_FULL_41_12]
MPKLKTHSGTKDRIKITKNGKVMRRHGGVAHNLQKKSASRKRTFAGSEKVSGKSVKNMKRKLGVQ